MTHLQMMIFSLIFIFSMTTLGAAIVFCFKKEISRKFNAIFLGAASGIMIAASIWSLLLPAIEQARHNWGNFVFFPIGAGFTLGALFLFILGKIISLFESKTRRGQKAKRASVSRATKLFIAVTLHNIPEGLAVGFAFGVALVMKTTATCVAALGLAVGIGIQNFPEGAAVSMPIKGASGSKLKGFLYGAASGIVEPIFALIGLFMVAYLQPLQPWLLSFSAGAMMFVVAEELIPEANAGGAATSTAWGIILGFLAMMTLDISC